MHQVETLLGLLVVAMAVAAAAHRLRLPAPSLLVVVGLGVGFVPGVPRVEVPPLAITIGVLPPLLFAAAEQVSLPDLAAVWRPVASLAVGLVVVTAAAVAGATHLIEPSVGLAVGFVLGAILASTDPVAVTALSRRLRLPERVGALVQSESLFNDATSLVLFQVAVAVVATGSMSAGSALVRFVAIGGGGALIGVATGWLGRLLLRRTGDPVLQTASLLLIPYVAAVAAEAATVSPVMAVIVSGLVLAAKRGRFTQPRGRLMAGALYETLVFLLESAVFALIGLELATFVRDLPAGQRATTGVLLVVVTATLLVVRAAALLGGVWVPRLRRTASRQRSRDERSWQTAAVVTWAGARGVIPLAAALSVPLTVDSGAGFPDRALLLVVATAATVLSLVVQGTTLEWLVQRLGVAGDPGQHAAQLARGHYALLAAALSALPEASAAESASPGVVEALRRELQHRADVVAGSVDEAPDGRPTSDVSRRLRHRLLSVEGDELARLRATGEISAEVYRELQRQLDLEGSRLSG